MQKRLNSKQRTDCVRCSSALNSQDKVAVCRRCLAVFKLTRKYPDITPGDKWRHPTPWGPLKRLSRNTDTPAPYHISDLNFKTITWAKLFEKGKAFTFKTYFKK